MLGIVGCEKRWDQHKFVRKLVDMSLPRSTVGEIFEALRAPPSLLPSNARVEERGYEKQRPLRRSV